MRMRTAAASLVLLAACSGPLPWQVPAECGQTRDFAFASQSSFATLGISTGSDTDKQTGYVWVTSGPVPRDYISGVAFPSGVRPGPARLACVLYPDGSAAIVEVPDDWQPPDD
jgi:hypothetical protein